MEPNEKIRMLPAEQGVYTLLGFAQKAGCLFGGSDVVAQAVSRGQARLVLLAWDLSDNSYRRFWQHQLGEQEWDNRNFGTMAVLEVIERIQEHYEKRPALCGGKFYIDGPFHWALQDENFCRGILGKLQQLQSVAPNVASPAEK